jgi:hypothetical protein
MNRWLLSKVLVFKVYDNIQACLDITLNRMEIIMKLKLGSHQGAPRWIWTTLICSFALVLPSAALSNAQDEPKLIVSEPVRNTEVSRIASQWRELTLSANAFKEVTMNWARVDSIAIRPISPTQTDAPAAHSKFRELRIATLSDQDVESLSNRPTVQRQYLPKEVSKSGQTSTISSSAVRVNFEDSNVDMLEDRIIRLSHTFNNEGSIDLTLDIEVIHTPVREAFASKAPTRNVSQFEFKEKLQGGRSFAIAGLGSQVDGNDCILIIGLTPVIGDVQIAEHLKYEPLLLGTAPGENQQVSILGPLTSIASLIVDYTPREGEIMHAIEKKRTELGEPAPAARPQKQKYNISLKKISKSIVPAKFVPLIGNAERHHTYYECTIETNPVSGLVETLYIDHNHFHMVD